MKDSRHGTSIKKVINAHDYVLYEIAMNIGFNIRTDSMKKEGKDEIYTLKAILPYEIRLTNSHVVEGNLILRNVGEFVFTKTRNGYLLKKESNIEAIDKELKTRVDAFIHSAKIESIKFAGIESKIPLVKKVC